jgi:uncharacterized protein (DUF433 family)
MHPKPPFDRITIEPGKLGGQPGIRGMRITVRRVLEILAMYSDRIELFADCPDLEEEDLQQALGLAAAAVDGTIDFQNASRSHRTLKPGQGPECPSKIRGLRSSQFYVEVSNVGTDPNLT